MSALEQLKGIIGSGFPGLAEQILNDHARELAGEIRREGGCGLCDFGCKDFDADLIDPEVQ